MRNIMTLIAVLGLGSLVGLQVPAFGAEKTPDNPNGCKVIQRGSSDDHSLSGSSVSSSVTAGGGRVSGSTTTGAGGNSVTIHSGNGNSVATAGTTGNGSSAMVATGDGGCVITVDPGKRREP